MKKIWKAGKGWWKIHPSVRKCPRVSDKPLPIRTSCSCENRSETRFSCSIKAARSRPELPTFSSMISGTLVCAIAHAFRRSPTLSKLSSTESGCARMSSYLTIIAGVSVMLKQPEDGGLHLPPMPLTPTEQMRQKERDRNSSNQKNQNNGGVNQYQKARDIYDMQQNNYQMSKRPRDNSAGVDINSQTRNY